MRIGRVIVLLVAVGVLALLGLGGIRAYQRSLDRQGESLHARVLPSGGPDDAQVTALAQQAAAIQPAKAPTASDYLADVNATIAKVPGASPAMLEAVRDTLASLPGTASDAVETALHRGDLDPKARAELTRVAPMLRRRAAAERKHTDDERAYFRAALAEYQQHGNRNPKWDAAACKALTLLIDSPPSATQPVDNPATAAGIDLLNRAFDVAFCSDPLLRHVRDRLRPHSYAEQSQGMLPDEQTGARNAAIGASGYPNVWKVDLYDGLASPALMDPNVAKQPFVQFLMSGINYSKGDLDAFFASDAFTPAEKLSWARNYLFHAKLESRVGSALNARRDLKSDFDVIEPELTNHLAGRVEPLLLKGEFYVQYAWEGRGEGFAKDVTPQGWQLMRERLPIAEAALQQAWKLDPSDPRAATIMLSVKLGQQAERSDVQQWFARAMEADPDNYDACMRMLYYLEPRWFGTPEEMLRFAYTCRDTHNFRGRLPLIVAEAHTDLARAVDQRDLSAYLSKPEIGNDIHDVFERYLALYPNDRPVRARYACLAALSHRWHDANQQFRVLGDNPTPGVFENYGASYENLQQQAAQHAGVGSSHGAS